MSKTVKLALGAAVVAVVYVGSTWYVGGRVKGEVHKQAAVVQDFLATHSSMALFDQKRSFNITHYERGLFSSTVQYEVELADAETDFTFKLEDKIYHGPLPIAAGHFAPALAVAEGQLVRTVQTQAWFDAAQNQRPITTKTVFGFGGTVKGQAQLAAVNYTDPEAETTLTTETVAVGYDYQNKTGEITVDVTAPKLSVMNPEQFKLELSQLRIHVNANENPAQAHYDSVLNVDTLHLNSTETGVLDLKGLEAKANYAMQGELMNVAAAYALQQIVVEGTDYGRLDFDVKAKNLHQDLLNQMALVAESEQPEDEAKLRVLIGEFLGYEPELEHAKLTWTNQSGNSAIATRMKGAPALVQHFKEGTALQGELSQVYEIVTLDIALSRPMLQQVLAGNGLMASMFDMLFDSAVEAGQEVGLVTYDGTEVRLQFAFDAKQDTLLLNNKPITEDELLQLFLALQMGGLL
ncbi:MAG TPA: YdgA family protein [Paenalcaligenes hominis]|uniref:YdgA family protein n=1 Tax=Paenalcaligenes hominis TaxID=643674 RepID=A0A9D3ABN9_9BURK|nr:YdgA family protein [Paenalcaligenes hominis]